MCFQGLKFSRTEVANRVQVLQRRQIRWIFESVHQRSSSTWSKPVIFVAEEVFKDSQYIVVHFKAIFLFLCLVIFLLRAQVRLQQIDKGKGEEVSCVSHLRKPGVEGARGE